MTKPVITTRAGKGSALTWTEGDTNLTNLRDATITVSDGTNSKAIDLNGTIQFTAGSNMTVGVNSSTGVVTISTTATTNTGTVTSVAALTLGTTGTDVSSTVSNSTTTPVITLNIPTASATNRGALSSTDWSTFNGKQAALVSGTNIKTINSTSILGSGDLTVSASPAGSNQQIQYNNNGVLGASSGLYYDGTSLKCSSGNIESLYSNGDEGGEFRLATAATNTTLAGGSIAIDIYQNKLRFFETGGSARGYYLDISSGGSNAGTNLVSSGGGYSTAFIQPTTIAGTLISGNLYRQTISEIIDTGNIISISSNQFTLTSGTYSVEFLGSIRSTNAADQAWYFRNVTDNTNVVSSLTTWPSTGNFSIVSGAASAFTISSTTTFEFRYDTGGGNTAIRGVMYKITKYS